MSLVCATGRETTACPACQDVVVTRHDGADCLGCGRSFPMVAGMIDWRLASDRYLGLAAERAKAERLAARAPATDLMGLASAYYDLTDDVVDHRRARFLAHIAGAEARGEALARVLPAAGSILEVGCGTGGLLAAAARSGRAIVGVDIASRWLVVARRRLDDGGLDVPLVLAEAERLPLAAGSFDVVVADSLVEHLDRPDAALREWARVLRPGGMLLVWSPNRYSLTTDPHLGLWGLGWLPRGWVGPYLKLRRRSDWPPRTLSAGAAGRLVRRHGFNDVQFSVPAIDPAWAATRPARERRLLGFYEATRRQSVGRTLLTAIGPLWELRARARGGPA